MKIVFDVSSSEDNFPSLNDCLKPGPKLTPGILVVLLQFRLSKLALKGDIEDAFLQRVGLQSLYFSVGRKQCNQIPVDKNLNDETEILKMTYNFWGQFQSNTILLSVTIKNHIRKYKDSHPTAFNSLNNRLYVDDLFSSLEDENLAYSLQEKIKFIFSRSVQNMKKWRTNILLLQEQFKEGVIYDE